MAEFLLEIGTEEIPDWMIDGALADLHQRFQAQFGDLGGNAIETFATPRRLVLRAKGLLAQAPDVQSVIAGPYLSAGAKAAEGFARKQGTTIDQLARAQDTKGERYVFHQLTKGANAHEALATKLPEVISNITFPKTMYWTGKGGVRFIRPIRWLVALLDDQVLPFQVAGVNSGAETRGHRILGRKGPISITIASYEQVLRENFVLVRPEERQARIESGLANGVQRDQELLKTLTYLTEYPSVIKGSFDPAYLELPREILSTVMRHHQRYFSVAKSDGSLAPEFVAVTNTDGDPDGLIRQGNEKVLRARFNDARFFWAVDQRKKLSERVEDLSKVTFQAKLGTYKDKTIRILDLAIEITNRVGADRETVERAVRLCKCDLTTDMVKEFTDLQGVVGGLYARAQGEGEAVATAIYDHYKPVGMDDSIPRTLEGQVVALADKLDTLRECFRIGLIPSGSKDPFALRRAGQGIVRILFEERLGFGLTPLIQEIGGLEQFFRERVEFYLREVLGFAYDEVKAVLAAPLTTLADVADRVDAIHYIRPTEDFEPLAASFKRIKNILRQAGVMESGEADPTLLAEGPEKQLYEAFQRVRKTVEQTAAYREKLSEIATLRPKVDLFFDKILVNDPDSAIRRNRLALLYSLLQEFSSIADFSEIVTQGASGV